MKLYLLLHLCLYVTAVSLTALFLSLPTSNTRIHTWYIGRFHFKNWLAAWDFWQICHCVMHLFWRTASVDMKDGSVASHRKKRALPNLEDYALEWGRKYLQQSKPLVGSNQNWAADCREEEIIYNRLGSLRTLQQISLRTSQNTSPRSIYLKDWE